MSSRFHGRRSIRRRRLTRPGASAAHTYRLLAELAARLGASVAYVDRATVEAHLERPLSAAEWTAIAHRLQPMAFDEHVGEAGTVRTDWIDDVLSRAGVPGRSSGPGTASPDDRLQP